MIDAAKIDTTIYIGNWAIHQPVTVLTDYIISVLCFYFYLQLNKTNHLKTADNSTNNWKLFFLFLSLASFFGGCAHGFFAIHEGLGYKSFWLTMQVLNVFSVYSAQKATFYSALASSNKKKFWNLSYHIQLVLFFIAIFVFQNFLVVVIDSIIGLVPIAIIHYIDSKKVKHSIWVTYGIMILFITAIVNATKFSFSPYFCYLDIAHVLIMANLSLMYIGIKRKAISLPSL
jgi:hypothetical protein